eukprot:g3894.t1
MGTGASVPVVPHSGTGEMVEAHYVKEKLGRQSVGVLCRELINAQSTIARLRLRECRLGWGTAEPLGLALANTEALSTIEIDCTTLSPVQDWGVLLDHMRHSATLTALELTRCGIGADGRLAVGDILTEQSVLRSLTVTHAGLGPAEAEQLALCVRDNMTLSALDVSHNPAIGPRGVEALARALHDGECRLAALRLHAVQMSGVGRLALPRQRRRGGGIRSRAKRAARNMPPAPAHKLPAAAVAEKLALGAAETDPTSPSAARPRPTLGALRVLLEAVRARGTLTALDIGGNWLGPAGAEAVARCLRAAATPTAPATALVSLGFGDNRLCCVDAEAMRMRHDSRWRYTGSALRALLAAAAGAGLTHLDLSRNHLQWDGAAAVAGVLADGRAGGTSLTSLDLGWNDICGGNALHDTRGLERLCRALAPGAEAEAAAAEAKAKAEAAAAAASDAKADAKAKKGGTLTQLDLAGNFLKAEGATMLADSCLGSSRCVLADLGLAHCAINRGKVARHAESGAAGGVEAYKLDNSGLRELLAAVERSRCLVKLSLATHDAEDSVRVYVEQERLKPGREHVGPAPKPGKAAAAAAAKGRPPTLWVDYGVRADAYEEKVVEEVNFRLATR